MRFGWPTQAKLVLNTLNNAVGGICAAIMPAASLAVSLDKCCGTFLTTMLPAAFLSPSGGCELSSNRQSDLCKPCVPSWNADGDAVVCWQLRGLAASSGGLGDRTDDRLLHDIHGLI